MNLNTSTGLQTLASGQTAKQQLDAGHGGSYTLDPKRGTVTLNERTAPGVAATKYPDAPRNQTAPLPNEAAGSDVTGLAG